eukprot:TRINITY_DN902_c1_g1_i3.p3 TRINITY_DN902_c1_g1~~TRINITY_DN902_c1_g1_i3.p3  ORF type:complete len:185 (-),score=32.90 TRINITY_DN902_c1_g1_i3:325-813(-)
MVLAISAAKPTLGLKTALPIRKTFVTTQKRSVSVYASVQKNDNKINLVTESLPVGVTAGLVGMMSSPLVAEAAVTPSLKNLLYSVYASVQKNDNKINLVTESLPVGVTAGLVGMMSSPLVAEAAVTPSLKNLLYSVLAGAVVVGAIAGAVSFVSSFDPVNRR